MITHVPTGSSKNQCASIEARQRHTSAYNPLKMVADSYNMGAESDFSRHKSDYKLRLCFKILFKHVGVLATALFSASQSLLAIVKTAISLLP